MGNFVKLIVEFFKVIRVREISVTFALFDFWIITFCNSAEKILLTRLLREIEIFEVMESFPQAVVHFGYNLRQFFLWSLSTCQQQSATNEKSLLILPFSYNCIEN